jgi:hypothetical protein
VTGPVTELSYPSPRALRDLRGIRRELCLLYREAKAGLIEPTLVGRLANVLNILQSMDNGILLERRVVEMEERIAALKPNGHGRTAGVRQ